MVRDKTRVMHVLPEVYPCRKWNEYLSITGQMHYEWSSELYSILQLIVYIIHYILLDVPKIRSNSKDDILSIYFIDIIYFLWFKTVPPAVIW